MMRGVVERISVLVVEDHEMVRDVLCAMITEAGFLASSAENAAEALEGARNTRFRLALIDLRLPGSMSGEELARLLRAAGTTVILMSADHARLDLVRRNETAPCLAKPFRMQELLDCIGTALANDPPSRTLISPRSPAKEMRLAWPALRQNAGRKYRKWSLLSQECAETWLEDCS
jgi:DNA-binding response OmpR family regulator